MFTGLSKFIKLLRNRNSADEEENIKKNESRINLNSNMDLRKPKGTLHSLLFALTFLLRY